jgi:hypothetical protein
MDAPPDPLSAGLVSAGFVPADPGPGGFACVDFLSADPGRDDAGDTEAVLGVES